MSKKVLIAIVNSSSFGVSFPEHLRELEKFADLIRVDIPNDAPASVFHEKLAAADGIIASVAIEKVVPGAPTDAVLATAAGNAVDAQGATQQIGTIA